MRIAEPTGSRALVTLATIGTLALAGAVLVTTWTSPAPPRPKRASPISPMRGCAERAKRQAPPAPVPAPTLSYREVLLGARDRLQACITSDADVGYRLALVIAPTGKVSSVEVKADARDLALVDLKVVKCLETAASPLAFAPAAREMRLSTYLHAR